MEPTSQDRAARSFMRESLRFVRDVFVILLIGIWLLVYVGFIVTSGFGTYIVAGWSLGLAALSVTIAIAEKREKHRAQAYAAAFANIEEAAKNVGNAGSEADRARNLVVLRQAIADAGKIGTASPISTLPDDSVTTIDSSIGAIQAEAEYERGKARQRERRTNVLTWVFGVFGILGTVFGLISLFK